MTPRPLHDDAGSDESEPWVLARAARTPGRIAVELDGTRVDYHELAQRAKAVVARLATWGVAAGDVVAVSLPNGIPIVELIHAAFVGDFVLLLLNRRLTAPEVEFQIRDSGARFFVQGDGDAVADAVELDPAISRISLVQRVDAFEPVGSAQPRSEPSRAISVNRALALSKPRFILYTSGTSGKPKGVVLSAANFLASAKGSAALLGADEDETWLLCMPVFHVGGLSILLRSTLAGSGVVIHTAFSPEAVNRDLDAGRATGVSLVANMLKRILDLRSESAPPPALRCVLLGGGPAPAPLLDAARRAGFPVAPTYGLTEAASQVATRPPDDEPTAGLRAIPGTQLRIVDDAGRTLDAGEAGEIWVRGPTVMSGYWNRPDATAEALRGGWLHTGDIGCLDRDGRLTVHDRRSDLILSGGENIYPAEVEAVLLEHPAVAEAGVSGEPDETFGARPVAWLVASEEGEVDAQRLDAHCRARLARYKCPVKFVWRPSLPRTANGKLIRRELGSRGHETGE